MKYSYGKKELLEDVNDLVSKLYKKEEESYNKELSIRESARKLWVDECERSCEKYKQLPDNWWKQFVEFKEVKISSGLFFKETRISEEFNIEKANEYLMDEGIGCNIAYKNTSDGLNSLFNIVVGFERYEPSILQEFETSRYNGCSFGDFIFEYEHWCARVNGGVFNYPLLEEHSKNYYNLKEIQSKIESVPENVSEIILEDHDIEVIKIAKRKVE